MRLRAFLDRRRLAAGGDGGFSLVEAVIALMIAAGVFSSVSVALLQTVRSSVQARQVQLATDLMNQQVEYVRSLDYAKATEIKADLAGDPDLTYNSGTNTYTLVTSSGTETVVAGTVGLIQQHIESLTRQNALYQVKTYVTKVVDPTNANADYRRVTVLASWTTNGVTRTRRSSSFMTDTRRGLPLPRFTMGTTKTYYTNVGATLAIAAKITNVGAPDAFNLSATPSASGPWTWYYDSNADGVYTSADLALGDSDANGVTDTGLLQVSGSITVFAVRTVGTGESTNQTLTVTATSSAQPTALTATNGFSVQVLVNPASCSGCTLTTYYLHNSSVYNNTVFQSTSGSNTPMLMDKSAPAANRALLYDYATNCASAIPTATDCAAMPAGRYVQIGGSANESDRTKVATWYYSVPSVSTFAGTASITIWVRPSSGLGTATSVTASIGTDTNYSISGSWQQYGSVAVAVPAQSTPDWIPLTIGVPISGTMTVNNNNFIGLRITANGALNLRVAYDTTIYNASAVLPVVSGG